jgi:hypothetical protein
VYAGLGAIRIRKKVGVEGNSDQSSPKREPKEATMALEINL